MTEVLCRVELENGLALEFIDQSNRYFGDYHRVLIEVEAFYRGEDALQLRYQRPLQRMGVPGSEVEKVKTQLIEDFLRTTSTYINKPDFIDRLRAALRRPGQQLWRTIP